MQTHDYSGQHQPGRMTGGPVPHPEHGERAVVSVLEGIVFPILKDDVIEQYGGEEIEWLPGIPMSLDELLADVPQEEFESLYELVSAVSDAASLREPQY